MNTDKTEYFNMKDSFPHLTFAEQVMLLCDREDIKSGNDFAYCTFVCKSTYYRLRNNRHYIPDEKIAYSICFGLRLSFAESCYLLRLAGMDIVPRTPDDKYRELLVKMLINGNTFIPSCNKELRRLGYQELGSVKKR